MKLKHLLIASLSLFGLMSCGKSEGTPIIASGVGESVTIDLGREISIKDISWAEIKGVTVSQHEVSGTIYNFVIPANIITTWSKITTDGAENSNPIFDGITENDPDAIPTFTAGVERTLVGIIDGVLQIEIPQGVGVVPTFEYYGRCGSLLTDDEKREDKNRGHTRKRAVITTADVAPSMIWSDANQYCEDLGGGWYLPSRNQLIGVWVAYSALTAFTTNTYWSSTEFGSSDSWLVDFYNDSGSVYFNFKGDSSSVRCIKDL